ncbi:MAG TPA: antibiotic biosynthesis monooxygenase [Polyangium sp.]|nr:antibiotic biosynthesis monooxygenase [Polyangium sp.]
MSEVHVVSRHFIKSGKLGDFELLASTARQMARDKEPGTLSYRWYFHATSTTFVVLHRYENAAAFMQHVANFKEIHRALDDLCETRIEVFGCLSPEAQRDLAEFGVVVFSPHGGEHP